MRESFAIGLFLISYKYLLSKQWVKYYLYSLLAISFHISAVITLIIPLFKFLFPLTKKLSLLYFLFIVLIFITPHMHISTSALDFLMSEKMSTNASFYLDESAASISLVFILFFTIEYYIYRIGLRNRVNTWLIVMLLFSLTLTIMGRVVPILYRFDNYFAVPVAICLSTSINNMVSKRNQILSTFFILSLILLLNFSYISSYWNINSHGEQQISYYVPYRSIF